MNYLDIIQNDFGQTNGAIRMNELLQQLGFKQVEGAWLHTRAAITLFAYQDTCVMVYNADGVEFVTKHTPIAKDDIVKGMMDIKRVLELKKGIEE